MIDLRFFNFCPIQQQSVLGLVCQDCQYLVKAEGECRCAYVISDESEGYSVKEIIIRLLACLEEGQVRISEEELLALLGE